MARILDFTDGFESSIEPSAVVLAASTVSNTPSGNLAATNVQTALDELQADIDTRATSVALTSAQALDLKIASNLSDLNNTATARTNLGLGNVDNTSDVTKNAAAVVLTNKDIDGGTSSNTSRITLPKAAKATLDGLTRKAGTLVFDTTSNKPYYDDGTDLQLVGSGSGSGSGVNYISNPDAETNTTGWATYADVAGTNPVDGTAGLATTTYTRSTSSPLRGTASFLMTKDAANRQGEGFSYDFTIAAADKGKVLACSFNYAIASGTYANDDVKFWIYDVTNAALIQPTPFKLKNHTLAADRMFLEFQTATSSTSYRLIGHIASTSALAYTLKFDDFLLGPQAKLYGSAVTDWKDETEITGSWVTNTTYACKSRIVGDTKHYQFKLALTGAPTATALSINLPSGDVIDTGKLSEGSTVQRPLPNTSAWVVSAGVGYFGQAFYDTTTSIRILVLQGVTSANNTDRVTQAVPGTFANGDLIDISFSVPIVGKSSSQVMSSDADTRVVQSSLTSSVTTIATTNTVIIPTTVASDTHGTWNAVTGTWTCPVSGYYTWGGNVQATASLSYVYMGVSIDSGALVIFAQSRSGTASAFLFAAGSSSGYIAAESTLQVKAAANTGTSAINQYIFYINKIQGPAQIAASESVSALYTGAPPTGTLTSAFNTTTFGTKVKDSHNAYASGTYTVPSSGTYDISAQARQSATYALNKIAAISVFIDGTEKYTGQFIAGGAQGEMYPQVNVKSVPLLAGQLVTIRSYNDATTPTFGTGAANNFFSITRTGNY